MKHRPSRKEFYNRARAAGVPRRDARYVESEYSLRKAKAAAKLGVPYKGLNSVQRSFPFKEKFDYGYRVYVTVGGERGRYFTVASNESLTQEQLKGRVMDKLGTFADDDEVDVDMRELGILS